jgi:transcriptional regulator
MYSPAYAIETDRAVINEVIKDYPFATLSFIDQNEIQSFHLPLLLEHNLLIGHLARANPVWKNLEGQKIQVIFHGPHGYISPNDYGEEGNVPTWNYVAIHVKGKVSVRHEEDFLVQALIHLSKEYDPRFGIQKNIGDHKGKLASIVGIEIEILEVFAKFKLAQSKSDSSRKSVIRNLQERNPSLAKAMQNTLKKND